MHGPSTSLNCTSPVTSLAEMSNLLQDYRENSDADLFYHVLLKDCHAKLTTQFCDSVVIS